MSVKDIVMASMGSNEFNTYYEPYLIDSRVHLKLDTNAGGGIIDAAKGHTLLNNGGAVADSRLSPYGGGSVYFNGLVDTGIVVSSPEDMNFGLDDFTVEFMIYQEQYTGDYACFFSNHISGQYMLGLLWFGIDSSNYLMPWGEVGLVKSLPTALGLKKWHHVAVTRKSLLLKIWVDGVGCSEYNCPANLVGGKMYIGETNSKTQQFHGLMQGFRVTKGVALYDETFGMP